MYEYFVCFMLLLLCHFLDILFLFFYSLTFSFSFFGSLPTEGAVLEAVDRVLHGEAHNAFCAVRPPGHHAGVELHCMGAVSNGFCILNNVALAALYAHHYG